MLNITPITWKASTTGPRGEVICSEADNDCGLLTNTTSVLGGQFLRFASGLWRGSEAAYNFFKSTPIPSNKSAINVTVSQTPKSRETTIKAILSSVFDAALGQALPSNCKGELAAAIISPNEVIELLGQGSGDGLLTFFQDISAAKLQAIMGSAFSCAFWEPPAQWISARLRWAFGSAVTSGVSIASNAIDAIDIGGQIWFAIEFWRVEPRTVGACIADGTLVNCAATLEFSKTDLYLAPGARADSPLIDARDLHGQPTVARGLRYETDGPQFASVAADSGRVEALPIFNSIESGTVRATLDATGASDTYRLHVVVPVITPRVLQVGRGTATPGFTLKSADGNAVVLPDDVQWEVVDGSGKVTIVWALLGWVIVVAPDALLGDYEVRARCPNCGGLDYGTATVSVVEPSRYDIYTFRQACPVFQDISRELTGWRIDYSSGSPVTTPSARADCPEIDPTTMWVVACKKNGTWMETRGVITRTDSNPRTEWSVQSDGRFYFELAYDNGYFASVTGWLDGDPLFQSASKFDDTRRKDSFGYWYELHSVGSGVYTTRTNLRLMNSVTSSVDPEECQSGTAYVDYTPLFFYTRNLVWPTNLP